MSGLEWVFEGIGWALVAAGVALLPWAVWWDKARGRRRCGRCWYDMGAVAGLRCPECGREAASERGLLRTRRRWRWAAFAVVLVAAGWCVMNVQAVRLRSAWALMPRPALALLLPMVESPPAQQGGAAPPVDHLAAEIRHRYLKDAWTLRRLWPGERLALRSGASMALRRGGAERFAAKMLVLAAPGAPGRDGRANNAHVVLARMALEYARCATYRDEGLVKGSIGGRDEKPFVTVFERDGRMRFEFRSGHPFQAKLTQHYVVWGPIAAPKSWWTIGGQVQEFNDIGMALAGPTGVSGGSAMRVPSMLLARDLWSGISTLEGISRVEAFDGRRCYVIRGKDFLDFPVDVWIDCEQFVLRKLHQHWEFPSVTVYRPRLGAAVNDADFAFDPAARNDTPLGDGERVSGELRGLAGDPREGAVPVPEDRKMKLPVMPGR